jgi:hypothetical protein
MKLMSVRGGGLVRGTGEGMDGCACAHDIPPPQHDHHVRRSHEVQRGDTKEVGYQRASVNSQTALFPSINWNTRLDKAHKGLPLRYLFIGYIGY